MERVCVGRNAPLKELLASLPTHPPTHAPTHANSLQSLRCSEELLVVSGGVGTVDKDTIGIWTLNHLKDYLDADLSTSPSESKQQMCGPEPSQRLSCELPTAVGSSDNTTVHWAGLCCAICVFLERG